MLKTVIPGILLTLISSLATATAAVTSEDPSMNDPYLWLEEVDGPRALDWVRSQNEPSLKRLKSDARFAEIEKGVRSVVLASDRIPYGYVEAGEIYNFWQDSKHVRGIWRRASIAEYAKPNPAWETLLDI